MIHAQRFLRTDGAGSYSPPRLAIPKMNYIELLNRFDQLDTEQCFSPSATRLYVKLLAECNRGRWQNPFTLSDRRLSFLLGGSVNTMKKARTELHERGLLCYQSGGNGAGDSCVYALQSGQEIAPLKVSKSDTLPANKVSGMVSISDTLSGNKVSGKVSEIDTIYKEVNKNSSVVENKDEEVGREASSSAAVEVEKKVTPQPASKAPVPGTEGGRGAALDEDATDADHCPMLTSPDLFRAACIDEGYTGIDYEHYRREILNSSRDEGLVLPAFKWRRRLRRWLSSEKKSRSGLVPAPVAGQKADPRAVQPLASKSSANPTKVKSFS